MADIEIAGESLRCVLSTQGGLIWRLEADLGHGWQGMAVSMTLSCSVAEDPP